MISAPSGAGYEVSPGMLGIHGGTIDSPAPTGVTVGDQDLEGNFRRALLRKLCAERGQSWHQKWVSLAEQGGFANSVSLAPKSNFWLRDCRYLRYSEFRWAIKAQLNLLPVGQALLILAAAALVAIHCWKTIKVHQPKCVLEGEGHHVLLMRSIVLIEAHAKM